MMADVENREQLEYLLKRKPFERLYIKISTREEKREVVRILNDEFGVLGGADITDPRYPYVYVWQNHITQGPYLVGTTSVRQERCISYSEFVALAERVEETEISIGGLL